MSRPDITSNRTWSAKFRDAIRGVRVGIRGQSSFAVHLTMIPLVVVAAILLQVNVIEWCVLVLCVAIVMTAEMFNSAVESCSHAITFDYDENLRDALDMCSAAVLLSAVGAAVTGATIFLFRLGLMLGWWDMYRIV